MMDSERRTIQNSYHTANQKTNLLIKRSTLYLLDKGEQVAHLNNCFSLSYKCFVLFFPILKINTYGTWILSLQRCLWTSYAYVTASWFGLFLITSVLMWRNNPLVSIVFSSWSVDLVYCGAFMKILCLLNSLRQNIFWSFAPN